MEKVKVVITGAGGGGANNIISTIKERENILNLKKLIPLKISKNILRSETAAISMISIICFNLLS